MTVLDSLFRKERLYFEQFASESGFSGSNVDMNHDYSLEEGVFKIMAPEGYIIELHRLLLTIQGRGSTDSSSYATIDTLENGIEVLHTENGVPLRPLNDTTIKSTVDWSGRSYDSRTTIFGTNDVLFQTRLSFDRGGTVVKLFDDRALEIHLSDDLSGLNRHRMLYQGNIRKRSRWDSIF